MRDEIPQAGLGGSPNISPMRKAPEKARIKQEPKVNCTPFVRQYDILNNKWGVLYAKRSAKQKVYAGIQEACCGNHDPRRTKLSGNREKI